MQNNEASNKTTKNTDSNLLPSSDTKNNGKIGNFLTKLKNNRQVVSKKIHKQHVWYWFKRNKFALWLCGFLWLSYIIYIAAYYDYNHKESLPVSTFLSNIGNFLWPIFTLLGAFFVWDGLKDRRIQIHSLLLTAAARLVDAFMYIDVQLYTIGEQQDVVNDFERIVNINLHLLTKEEYDAVNVFRNAYMKFYHLVQEAKTSKYSKTSRYNLYNRLKGFIREYDEFVSVICNSEYKKPIMSKIEPKGGWYVNSALAIELQKNLHLFIHIGDILQNLTDDKIPKLKQYLSLLEEEYKNILPIEFILDEQFNIYVNIYESHDKTVLNRKQDIMTFLRDSGIDDPEFIDQKIALDIKQLFTKINHADLDNYTNQQQVAMRY